MSYTLVIRPQAEADVAEAHAWYEERRPGLGDDFLDQVDVALQRILVAPLRNAVMHREIRRALTRRFPFAAHGCHRLPRLSAPASDQLPRAGPGLLVCTARTVPPLAR